MTSLFSAKVLPLIILMLLPSLLLISHFLFEQIKNYYIYTTISEVNHTLNIHKIPEIAQQGFLKIKFAGTTAFYFQIGLIMIIVIIYPLYPYIYSKDKYFKKKSEI